jgi:hypothetical protein
MTYTFNQVFHEVGENIISYMGFRLTSFHSLLLISKDVYDIIKEIILKLQYLTLSSTKCLEYVSSTRFQYLQKIEICIYHWDFLRYKSYQVNKKFPNLKDVSFYGMDINTGKMAYFTDNDIPLQKEEHIIFYLLENTKECFLNKITIHNVPINPLNLSEQMHKFHFLHYINLRTCLGKIIHDSIIEAFTPNTLEYLYIEDCSISTDQIEYLKNRLLKNKNLKYCTLSLITPIDEDYDFVIWKKTIIQTLFNLCLHTKQDTFILNNNILNTKDLVSYIPTTILWRPIQIKKFIFKIQSYGNNNDRACLESVLPLFPYLEKFENNTTLDITLSLPQSYKKLSSLKMILCSGNLLHNDTKTFFETLSDLNELRISLFRSPSTYSSTYLLDAIAFFPKNLSVLHIHRNQFISKREAENFILGISYLTKLEELELSVTSLYNPQYQENELFSYLIGKNLFSLKHLHIKRMYRDINDISNLIDTMFTSNLLFPSLQLFVIQPFLCITDKYNILNKVRELRQNIRFILK